MVSDVEHKIDEFKKILRRKTRKKTQKQRNLEQQRNETWFENQRNEIKAVKVIRNKRKTKKKKEIEKRKEQIAFNSNFVLDCKQRLCLSFIHSGNSRSRSRSRGSFITLKFGVFENKNSKLRGTNEKIKKHFFKANSSQDQGFNQLHQIFSILNEQLNSLNIKHWSSSSIVLWQKKKSRAQIETLCYEWMWTI